MSMPFWYERWAYAIGMLVDVRINHENTGKNDCAAQLIGTTAEGDEMQNTRFEWVLKNARKNETLLFTGVSSQKWLKQLMNKRVLPKK